MTKSRVSSWIVFLLAFCIGVAVPALAYNARIVRLSLVDGDVQIDRNVGQGVERAILNTPITSGVRLQAMQGGRAEVEFENGSTMRLAGPAEVVFRELSMNDGGDKVTFVEVNHGTVYFDIQKKGDDDFRIAWAGQTVRLAKSAHLRVEALGQQAKVAVFKGEAEVEGDGEHSKVKKNETLTLDYADSDRYELAKGVDGIDADDWDHARENYREQYADASGYQYANSAYGAQYSYGMTDMLQYGSYFNDPGYGWLWRPTAFDPTWDPFANGAWSYYPGQGYVFVSTYPWGWTPYRYGQWQFIPQYGWCWSPAGSYRNWNVAPIIRNPPRGFLPLRRPDPHPGPVLFVNGRHEPTPRVPDSLRRTFNNDNAAVVPGTRNSPTAADADNQFEHRTRDRNRPLPNANVNNSNPAKGNANPQGNANVRHDGEDNNSRRRQMPNARVPVNDSPAMSDRGSDANRGQSGRRDSGAPTAQPGSTMHHDTPSAPRPTMEPAPSRPATAPTPHVTPPSVRNDAPKSSNFRGGGGMPSAGVRQGGGHEGRGK